MCFAMRTKANSSLLSFQTHTSYIGQTFLLIHKKGGCSNLGRDCAHDINKEFVQLASADEERVELENVVDGSFTFLVQEVIPKKLRYLFCL